MPIVINTVHGFYFHENMGRLRCWFYVALEKIAARCSDSILSQNQEDIATAVRVKICPPERIKWLGNGIDLSAFRPEAVSRAEGERERAALGIPAGAKVVGFVGRLAAVRKGFLHFLQAAERVAKQNPAAHFLIAGNADRGKPDAVEPATAKAYGIWERCHFVGQRPNADLPLLYSLMDVLVLPSIFEGLPRVIMEASAMGVPSVASNVKGNREAVQHGKTGLLVPYGEVEALSRAILDVIGDPGRRRRMGENARQLALEQFDERVVFAKLHTEYARLLWEKQQLREKAVEVGV